MMKVYGLLILFLSCTISISAQLDEYVDLPTTLSPKVKKRAQWHHSLLDSLEQTDTPVRQILDAQITAAIFFTHHEDLKVQSDSLLQIIFANEDLNSDKALLSRAITTRGIAEFKQRKFEQAIQSHYDAIAIREQEGDPTISYNYHLIGLNLMVIENYEEALRNYLKAEQLRANRKTPNPKLTQRIASAYRYVGDLKNAEQKFLQSIAEAQQIKSTLIEGTSLARLARLYSSQGQYQRAIDMLEESLIKRKGQMHIGHKITLPHDLAQNHLALGNTKVARINANKSYHIAKQINKPGYQQMVLRTLVDIDQAEGQKDSAILHYKLLLTARDSFYNIENSNKFNELYTKLELGDKEREILKKEVIIQQESRTRNTLYMIIGLLSVLGMLGGLLIRNKITHEKKITAQNAIIKTALSEKEILLKEIHHRVKNNLQIVSSLLGMQSLSIKDESVKIAIDEGRARVHSMSLIHQNLYKKEKLTGIEMKPYLSQLCADLIRTYHYEDKEIALDIDVEDELWLDVETVVPLGLIINELITNSLKHAFADQNKGALSISLKIENDMLLLRVADDGSGISHNDLTNDTFGHSLITAFKDKLDAELLIDSTEGTAVTLTIRSFNTV